MNRIYAVIEFADRSTFDASSDQHLDELADDLLRITDGVTGAVVYTSAADLIADEESS